VGARPGGGVGGGGRGESVADRVEQCVVGGVGVQQRGRPGGGEDGGQRGPPRPLPFRQVRQEGLGVSSGGSLHVVVVGGRAGGRGGSAGDGGGDAQRGAGLGVEGGRRGEGQVGRGGRGPGAERRRGAQHCRVRPVRLGRRGSGGGSVRQQAGDGQAIDLQAGGELPVAGGARVRDRPRQVPGGGIPAGADAVQGSERAGVLVGQLALQDLAEQGVDAVPPATPAARSTKAFVAASDASIRRPSGRPVSRSSRSGHIWSVTLIRSRKQRTTAGWWASTSADRYWATLPSSAARAASSCSTEVPRLSGAAASRRATAQPSVAAHSAAATPADTGVPSAANSAAVSSPVNASWSARISVSELVRRYRCRGSSGSARAHSTSRSRVPA
jgi:hypothetical protein